MRAIIIENIPENIIDVWIDEWHTDRTIKETLAEYLGMTTVEYKQYVENHEKETRFKTSLVNV